jgi:hypothetical protein
MNPPQLRLEAADRSLDGYVHPARRSSLGPRASMLALDQVLHGGPLSPISSRSASAASSERESMETLHAFLASTRAARTRNNQASDVPSGNTGQLQLPEICWVWPPCLTVGEAQGVTVKFRHARLPQGHKCYVLAVIGDTVVADSRIRPASTSITWVPRLARWALHPRAGPLGRWAAAAQAPLCTTRP